jgi:hypothetical protein
MPSVPGFRDQSASTPSLPPIADRVRQRLTLVGLAFDRRLGAARPRRRAPKLPQPSVPAGPPSLEPGLIRERACLRVVFRELGDAHRRYRVRTGIPGTPALRAAAYAFKQEPSVTSLVPVAAFLDELGILAW